MMKEIKNILLVQLTTGKWYKKLENYDHTKIPPIGLLSIASYLKLNGFKNVTVIDFFVQSFKPEEFEALIREKNIQFVGIGIYSESFRHANELANFIKKINSNIKIVAGSNFSTFVYKDILKNESFDFVVRGEGEVSALEILLHLNYPKSLGKKEIKGIAYRENDEIVCNADRTPVQTLNALPFYDRDQDLISYFEPSINTSRGCPGDCIYCSSRAFWGKKYRMRSAENVFAEFLYIHDKHGKIKKLNITEDTFTASPSRLLKICKYIKKSKIDIKWWCESRVDVLTKEILSEMKDAGLLSIQLGVESGDQKIVNSINKYITLEKVEQVLKWIQELGIHRVHCGFIIGLPEDDHESVEKTIEFAHHLQSTYSASVEASINTPFPGTYEYINAEKLGIKLYTLDWNQFVLEQAIIDTKHLNRQELQSYLLKFRVRNRQLINSQTKEEI